MNTRINLWSEEQFDKLWADLQAYNNERTSHPRSSFLVHQQPTDVEKNRNMRVTRKVQAGELSKATQAAVPSAPYSLYWHNWGITTVTSSQNPIKHIIAMPSEWSLPPASRRTSCFLPCHLHYYKRHRANSWRSALRADEKHQCRTFSRRRRSLIRIPQVRHTFCLWDSTSSSWCLHTPGECKACSTWQNNHRKTYNHRLVHYQLMFL